MYCALHLSDINSVTSVVRWLVALWDTFELYLLSDMIAVNAELDALYATYACCAAAPDMLPRMIRWGNACMRASILEASSGTRLALMHE